VSELPYIKLWVADHLAATAHLEPAEMGAYDRLLFIMWQQGGILPNKPELLARYCRMTVKQWERVAPHVLSFFVAVELEEGGIIYSERLTQELNDARKISETRRAVSKRKPRKNNNGREPNGEQTRHSYSYSHSYRGRGYQEREDE
jgi:uncharacterized protein YdaU (DUF1376 family)